MPNNTNNKVDIAADLNRIHGAITRALEVMIEKSDQYQQHLPNLGVLRGFTMFVDCFITFIQGHHGAEDDIAFPYFKDKLPETPYARLIKEHKEIVGILEKLDQANVKIKSSENVMEGLTELQEQLVQLKQIWYPHINSEETHLCSECICAVIPSEEQFKLAQKFGEYSQKHSKPSTLVLPFLLYNMNEQDRKIMSHSLPWMVTRLLVPIIWKRHWYPMQPYLVK